MTSGPGSWVGVRVRRLVIACALVAPVVARAQVTRAADEAFVRWASRAARPLDGLSLPDTPDDIKALRATIAGARIVGIGESQHSMHEFLEVRTALVRLLVTRLGFAALSLETGLPEARRVDAWITGRTADDPDFARDLHYGFGRDAETIAMLRWLREYNAGVPEPRRVRFYGVDIAANGGGSLLPALQPAWEFLDRVDAAFAATHRARVEPIARRIASEGWFDVRKRYDSLGAARRDSLRRGVEELVARFGSRRREYERRSSPDEAAWAERLATVARQTESYLRGGLMTPRDVRDAAMAANATWVMQRERSRGPIIVLAHNLHVDARRGTGPYYTERFKVLGYTGAPAPIDRMGRILRTQLGRGYANIATAFAENGGDARSAALQPASLDGLLSRVGPSAFFLDVRNAPRTGAPAWLDGRRTMRAQESYVDVVPRGSYDALVYVRSVRESDKRP